MSYSFCQYSFLIRSHLGGDLGFLLDIYWLFHPNSPWQVQEIQAGREPLQLLPSVQRPDRRHRWGHLVPHRLTPTSYFCRQIFFHFYFVVVVISWPPLFHVFRGFGRLSQNEGLFPSFRSTGSMFALKWLILKWVITSKITTHIPLEFSQCFFDSNENLFWRKHIFGE